MKTEVGRQAVWQHAEEADLQDMILDKTPPRLTVIAGNEAA